MLKDLLIENYEHTVNRGLIDSGTQPKEFILKLYEEVAEFQRAIEKSEGSYESEIADVILVAFNYCIHFDIDIKSNLMKNVLKNAARVDPPIDSDQ